MVIKMLQAISNMIHIPTSPEIPHEVVKANIRCAKEMLDKVIEGMIDAEKSTYATLLPPITETPIPPQHKPIPKPKVPETPAGQYKVVVDEMKKIVKIEGLPIDSKIELDGKVLTHQEAIGKTFTNARIL